MIITNVSHQPANRVEIIIEHDAKVIQLDVRIMPDGAVIVEAEHLTGDDPLTNGLSFTLEDDDKTVVMQLPS